MSNRGKGGGGDASSSLSAFAAKHWGGSEAVGSLLAHGLTACYLCCTVAMFVGVFAQARLPPSRRAVVVVVCTKELSAYYYSYLDKALRDLRCCVLSSSRRVASARRGAA